MIDRSTTFSCGWKWKWGQYFVARSVPSFIVTYIAHKNHGFCNRVMKCIASS